jgi:dipeptidyl aminopeptidase/acylaminoacyl peptidase
VPQSAAFTEDTLVRVRRLTTFDVSPDGRRLAVAIDELSADGKKYDTNLFALDLATPGAALVQLTRNTRKKAQPRFAPDGSLGFLAQPDPARRRDAPPPPPTEAQAKKDTRPEDEPMQVHRLRFDGSEPEALTDVPTGVRAFEWTPDGARLVMLAPVHARAADVAENARLEAEWKDRGATGVVFERYPLRFWDHWLGPRHVHLLVADASGKNARDLTPGLLHGLEETEIDVSPDGTTAAVTLTTWRDEDLRPEARIVLIDLASGARRAITSGPSSHWSARFSPDGRTIVCLTQPQQPRTTGKTDLALIDVASGTRRLVATTLDRWPVGPRWIDGSRVLFTCDDEGHLRLRALDVDSGALTVLVGEGHVTEPRPTRDGATIHYLLDRFDAPMDLWSVPSRGGAAVQLTRANAALLAGVPVASTRSVTYEGHDGRAIQLFEIKPPGFDASRKYPLLLWIHGGPVNSYMDQFHFRWSPQVYASAGYVLLLVNPRGSTGFGQDLIEGNNGNWGVHCYRDLMRAVDHYEQQPWVDRTRIAAMGGSFGGYMVNWIAGQTDRFRCLVSHAGLFNLVAFHGTTDSGPWWELEFGVPWEDAARYDAHSPHLRAGSFRTPTLVIHGELDYRVPLADGLQMFMALQRQRVPSKFLYFPDENHWILKPANMKLWNETVLAWLREQLG